MKQNFFVLIAIVCFGVSYSQNESNIWYFGSHAGLDFNSGSPVALTGGQIDTIEGVSSISDTNGSLLFYTDGMTVWNKNHMVMQNGTDLAGDYSSTQSAVIVPRPGSDSIYFIFTVDEQGASQGFRFSEVDMTLASGLGGVTTVKNVPLLSQSTEQVTAVLNANGTDVWVITHGYGNDVFKAYLVTAAGGVSITPVTSNAGLFLDNSEYNVIGYMKASPAGNKIAMCNANSGIQLLDFDSATGVVSNGLLLSSEVFYYGIEFSPSGNLLYASNQTTGTILQYDLQAADIAASKTVIKSYEDGMGVIAGALQLGPDGKIYLTIIWREYLSVINDPNVQGAGCNYEDDAVYLGGPTATMGLPTFIQSYFLPLQMQASNFCLGDATSFEIPPDLVPDAISWDFGDGDTSSDISPTHIYTTSGTYTAKVTVTIAGNDTSVEKTITIFPLPVATMAANMFLCDEGGDGQEAFLLSQQDGQVLGTQSPSDFTVAYYLSAEDAAAGTGALPDDYTNTANPQVIYAKVTNTLTGCYAISQFTIEAVLKPVIDMEDTYALCQGETVILTAPDGFDSYLWSTGQTTQSIQTGGRGSYAVTVFITHGDVTCEASKQITVSLSQPPEITGIETSDWTDNQNSITVTAQGQGNYEYSIDGVNYQASPVFNGLESGVFTVYVRDGNGCGKTKTIVYLLMYPKFFTPNGDGENETWKIKYARFEPGMKVNIFDRYGKFITSFKGTEPGWDGTLNGQRLPCTDYWFVVQRENGKEYKGHFSMIR
jgi:gliding motility-associated-like protein